MENKNVPGEQRSYVLNIPRNSEPGTVISLGSPPNPPPKLVSRIQFPSLSFWLHTACAIVNMLSSFIFVASIGFFFINTKLYTRSKAEAVLHVRHKYVPSTSSQHFYARHFPFSLSFLTTDMLSVCDSPYVR